ncbi:THAP domain-containing protein 4 [Dufourea novaeangliae]|nr:THAP domain-containing protein 4 [Dufourea novaeangliae]
MTNLEKGYSMLRRIKCFSLPLKDQEVCSKWLKVMGKENNEPSKYTAVCSLHFNADDYSKRPGMYVKRLKPDAVPTIIVKGAARVMPIVKQEINVTNIDGPSPSSNNIMDPLGAICSR